MQGTGEVDIVKDLAVGALEAHAKRLVCVFRVHRGEIEVDRLLRVG